MDKGTFAGIVLAIGGILLGLALEGGKIGQILQPTAALIVFGGTLGAVMVQFPLPVVLAAFASLAQVFFERGQDPLLVVKEMVGYAQKARKDGIVSLDGELAPVCANAAPVAAVATPPDGAGIGVLATSGSVCIACAISIAEPKRARGSRASARARNASIGGATFGNHARIGSGSCFASLMYMSSTVVAAYGSRPDNIS